MKITIDKEEMCCNNINEIKESILQPTNLILKNCYPMKWEENQDYTSRFFYPKLWSKCIITDKNKLIFAGAVKNTGNISLNPRMPKYANVEVIDFKSLLSEGETFDFVIKDKTIPEAIEQVVENISDYGFKVGNIKINDITTKIGAYNTQNQTAYDVFQYLSEISESRWFTRVIDENNIAIDFYSIDKLPLKPNIEYKEEYFCKNDIIDMNYSLSSRDYRNKQIITSDKVISTNENKEQFILTGYETKIILEQKIGIINKIFVNNVEKRIITSEEKNIGMTADFYYEEGTNIINFEKRYVAGTKIDIRYKSIVNARQIQENKEEINNISNSISRNGIISRYEVRNDIENIEQLQKVAQTYLNLKGKEEITLKIKSRKDIFNVGDKAYFEIPEFKQLQSYYLVKNKVIKIIGNNQEIFYSYELVNNYNVDNAINYFDNQRRKVSGNIQKGKAIPRNVDITNKANIIFKNIQIKEVTVKGNNILEMPLEGILNN